MACVALNARPSRSLQDASRVRRVAQSFGHLAEGQEVVVFLEGQWREALVSKAIGRSAKSLEVVLKETSESQRVPVHNVAVRLAGISKLRGNCSRLSLRNNRSRVAASVPTAPMWQIRLPGGCSKAKPAEVGVDAKVMEDVDKELHAKVDRGEVPGVVSLVFRQGVLAHLDCYGHADLERKSPMRPDSIVRLYSMTKCVISVGVAMCLEDDLLRLDDHLSKFIPAFANPMVKNQDNDLLSPAILPITLLHLLTHTSGLGYGPMLGDEADGEEEERFTPLIKRAGLGRTSPKDPDAVLTLEHWCEELAKIPLRSQPGKEWYYSYSFDIIGRVLEIVTGERLDQFLRRRVFEPLHMVDTAFEVPAEKWDRVAGIYRRDEAEESCTLKRIDSAEASKNEWIVGNASPILSGGGCIDQCSGGLVSTAIDYARFSMMLRNKGELDGIRVLKTESVDLFTKNMLPVATGNDDAWAFNTPGVGFCLLGSVSVDHPELDSALRPKEYGWGGMAGTAWTNDPDEDFSLLSFSLVAFDLTTEEELRAGVRKAIASAASKKKKEIVNDASPKSLAKKGDKTDTPTPETSRRLDPATVASAASPAKLRRPPAVAMSLDSAVVKKRQRDADSVADEQDSPDESTDPTVLSCKRGRAQNPN